MYTALTPGHLLKDLPIASKMLAAWVIGLAAARLPKPLLAASLLPLPVVLAVSIVASLLFGFGLQGPRLCLGFSHPNVCALVAAWGVLPFIILRNAYASRLRLLAFGAAGICVCGVVLTSSRSSLFALVMGCIFLQRNAIRKHFTVFIGVSLVIIGTIVS